MVRHGHYPTKTKSDIELCEVAVKNIIRNKNYLRGRLQKYPEWHKIGTEIFVLMEDVGKLITRMKKEKKERGR